MIGFDLQHDNTVAEPAAQEAKQALGRIRQQIREQEHARDLANHNIQVLRQAETELLDELDGVPDDSEIITSNS